MCDVMSNIIKDFSVSFSSPIGFEVEWHNSRFDKWYQSQGYGFESWECHCEGGIVVGCKEGEPPMQMQCGPNSPSPNHGLAT